MDSSKSTLRHSGSNDYHDVMTRQRPERRFGNQQFFAQQARVTTGSPRELDGLINILSFREKRRLDNRNSAPPNPDTDSTVYPLHGERNNVHPACNGSAEAERVTPWSS